MKASRALVLSREKSGGCDEVHPSSELDLVVHPISPSFPFSPRLSPKTLIQFDSMQSDLDQLTGLVAQTSLLLSSEPNNLSLPPPSSHEDPDIPVG